MRALAAALALATLAAPFAAPVAAQEAEPSPLQGVWSGTVGSYKVMACFDPTDGIEGAYYYVSQLKPIALRRAEEGAALTETVGFDTPTGATWTITRQGDEQITGQWNGEIAGKERQLPIRLSPVAAQPGEYSGVCESSAFVAPRFADSSVDEQADTFEGTAITRLFWQPGRAFDPAATAISSFAVSEERPGDAAINAALRKALPDGSMEHDFAACVAFTVAMRGWDGDYSTAVEPELITRDLVAINTNTSLYCGGAHPSYWERRQVFDRASGIEFDPAIWLKPNALTFVEAEYASPLAIKQTVTGLSPALMERVRANWPEPEMPECLAEEGLVFGWDLGVSREGMIFKPEVPHVATVCAVPVTVRWEELRPMLSTKGAALAASLR